MASYLRDVPNSIVQGTSLVVGPFAATTNGAGVDFGQGDGVVTAVIPAGVITDGTHVITFADSPDNVNFTTTATVIVTPSALTSAAGGSATQYASFLRTQRYVRATTTVSGATSGGGYGVSLFEQKKFIAN